MFTGDSYSEQLEAAQVHVRPRVRLALALVRLPTQPCVRRVGGGGGLRPVGDRQLTGWRGAFAPAPLLPSIAGWPGSLRWALPVGPLPLHSPRPLGSEAGLLG